MKFLTKIECEKLASRAGVEFRPMRRMRLPAMKHNGRFIYDLPRDPLARLWPVARSIGADLAEHLGSFTWALLWLHSYPFWWGRTHEENPPETWRHFVDWRRAVGEARPLRETPGHLFEPNEKSDLGEAIGF